MSSDETPQPVPASTEEESDAVKASVSFTIPELLFTCHVLRKHANSSLFNLIWSMEDILRQHQHYLGVEFKNEPSRDELNLLMTYTGKTKEEIMVVWAKHSHFEGVFDELA